MKSQHTTSSLFANVLLHPPSTSLSALALLPLSLKKQGSQMRPTHQHLCPYAVPLLLVQWKDKSYKGQPLHVCPRSHPLSYSVILVKQFSSVSLTSSNFLCLGDLSYQSKLANLSLPILPQTDTQNLSRPDFQFQLLSYFSPSLYYKTHQKSCFTVQILQFHFS